MKLSQLIPGALVVSGLLLGAVLAAPPSLAGQVQTLQPAEDRDVPEGSEIQQWRVQETETKVQDLKRQLREAAPVKQEAPASQKDAPAPKVEPPK